MGKPYVKMGTTNYEFELETIKYVDPNTPPDVTHLKVKGFSCWDFDLHYWVKEQETMSTRMFGGRKFRLTRGENDCGKNDRGEKCLCYETWHCQIYSCNFILGP